MTTPSQSDIALARILADAYGLPPGVTVADVARRIASAQPEPETAAELIDIYDSRIGDLGA